MWWQHSRSAGVIVVPGSTHAIAGVIAHSRAIVSSAIARVLVTLISVLRLADTIDTKNSYHAIQSLDHIALICSDPRHTYSCENTLTLSSAANSAAVFHLP
jgi:hypothetical protein